MNMFKKVNGMSIVGQGGLIILFMLPALVAAILANRYLPTIAALPESMRFIKPLGYVLFVPGFVLWAVAVFQLLTLFPQGKLITTGAYGVVRNPLYSSATFFILPAITFITHTWVYLVPAVFLYVGVLIFIRKEERQLKQVFGQEYQDYLGRVDRLIPFKKPR